MYEQISVAVLVYVTGWPRCVAVHFYQVASACHKPRSPITQHKKFHDIVKPFCCSDRPLYPQSPHSSLPIPKHRIAGISLPSVGNSLRNTLHCCSLKAVKPHATHDSRWIHSVSPLCLVQGASSVELQLAARGQYLRAAYVNRGK